MNMTGNALRGLLLLLTGTLALGAQAAPTQNTANTSTNGIGPRIHFETTQPDFGRARKGELVKYTYNFTNTGDRVLHVTNVTPGCGCTRAGDWTKEVEPGKSGIIPIQLNTANFQGHVTKFVTVTCDDKSVPNGMIQLMLKGEIWTPIEVSPQYLNFMVPADAPSGSGRVSITNQTEQPLYLSDAKCSNPAFTAELQTNAPGRGYSLVINRVPPLKPGVAQTQVTLKTSWTNPPVLTVICWANVMPPVTILPAQLTLPRPPLPNHTPFTITIQNATTNHMVLTDPTVNIKDVKVELREIQPGHYFNALLTFPPDFEIPSGEHVEFTAKTSLAKYPVITVPVIQLPKPMLAPPHPLAAPRLLPVPPQPRAQAR